MKRLVLIGEGHGEVSALPRLLKRVLKERGAHQTLAVDDDLVRARNPAGLVKWDKQTKTADYRDWQRYVRIAARRRNAAAVLAVFDGDVKHFPAGSASPFCAATAARELVSAAANVGAGKLFSLAVVFACVEFETWIVAGVESLAGKPFNDGRPGIAAGTQFPAGPPQSHGKRWLQENFRGYRETRDQIALTELVDLNVVRSKNLRSFKRLEHAVEELLRATNSGSFVSTPK